MGAGPPAPFMPDRSYDQDGAGGMAHRLFRRAAHNHVPEPRIPVGGHYDQVASGFPGGLGDLLERNSFPEFKRAFSVRKMGPLNRPQLVLEFLHHFFEFKGKHGRFDAVIQAIGHVKQQNTRSGDSGQIRGIAEGGLSRRRKIDWHQDFFDCCPGKGAAFQAGLIMIFS